MSAVLATLRDWLQTDPRLGPLRSRLPRDSLPAFVVGCLVSLVLSGGWRSLKRFLKAAEIHGVRQVLSAFVSSLLKKLPQVQRELAKECAKSKASVCSSLTNRPEQILPVLRALPQGRPAEEVLAILRKSRSWQAGKMHTGRYTGCQYVDPEKDMALIGETYGMFAFDNTLHADTFQLCRQFEQEVVRMTATLYNGEPTVAGMVSSGGTESILMSMMAYRERAKSKGRTEFNMVLPVSAHAAFWKGGHYFGIDMKVCPLDASGEVDLAKMRRMVDKNTIAVMGSAINYPHGTMDPIPEIAKIALEWDIGCHVDCCLGSFYVPFLEEMGALKYKFDWRVPGVTSISVDTHKYAQAPKGTSVVMFRNEEWRRFMYAYVTDWQGGIYATPMIAGSRAGGPIAVAWARLVTTGIDGYRAQAKRLYDTVHTIKAGVEAIKGLALMGRVDGMVVAFTTDEPGLNIYAVTDEMKKQGWDLAGLQNPPGSHMACTDMTDGLAFVESLKLAVDAARASGDSSKTMNLYCTAAKTPTAYLEECVGAVLDGFGDLATQ